MRDTGGLAAIVHEKLPCAEGPGPEAGSRHRQGASVRAFEAEEPGLPPAPPPCSERRCASSGWPRHPERIDGDTLTPTWAAVQMRRTRGAEHQEAEAVGVLELPLPVLSLPWCPATPGVHLVDLLELLVFDPSSEHSLESYPLHGRSVDSTCAKYSGMGCMQPDVSLTAAVTTCRSTHKVAKRGQRPHLRPCRRMN